MPSLGSATQNYPKKLFFFYFLLIYMSGGCGCVYVYVPMGVSGTVRGQREHSLELEWELSAQYVNAENRAKVLEEQPLLLIMKCNFRFLQKPTFETRFHYAALFGLELPTYTRLALNLQKSSWLCFLRTGIKSPCYHAQHTWEFL